MSTIATPGRSPIGEGAPAPVARPSPTGASTMREVRPRARRDHAGVEPVDARGVAGREGDDRLGRDAAERREVGHQPQDPQRDDAGAGRRVVAEDDPAERVRPPWPCRSACSAVRPLPQWTSSRAIPCRRRRAARCRPPGATVVPPLMWPAMSGPASRTTSAPMALDPGSDGPPVWNVETMPCCARPGRPSAPHRRRSSPIRARSRRSGRRQRRRSRRSRPRPGPCSRIGAPARTLTPAGPERWRTRGRSRSPAP